jgi:hypothetical protein
MKVIPLLIFWSLPFFQAGEHGQSFDCGDARLAEIPSISAVIQQAGPESSPCDSGSKGLGGSLWDEEDSLDDVLVDAGHILSRSLLIRVPDNSCAFSLGQHDFLRTPSHAYPFRC